MGFSNLAKTNRRGDEPPAPGSPSPYGAIFRKKYISTMPLDPSEAGLGHFFDFFL